MVRLKAVLHKVAGLKLADFFPEPTNSLAMLSGML
jgi:hypothetical protein